MSALGHKRTFRSEIAHSALPPKADITVRHCHRGATETASFCPVNNGVIRRTVTRRLACSGP